MLSLKDVIDGKVRNKLLVYSNISCCEKDFSSSSLRVQSWLLAERKSF